MNDTNKADFVVRKKKACHALGVCSETLRLWVKKGELPPPIKLGARAVGWLQSDIDAFLERRKQASRPAEQA